MSESLKKYIYRYGILAAIVLVALTLVILHRSAAISKAQHSNELQRNFTHQEHELVKFTKAVTATLREGKFEDLAHKFPSDAPFFLHVFRNDSLLYWNTNKMPVYSLAELHFPSEGLFNLQNGWYFSDMVKIGPYKIVGSFLLQQVYPYENGQLQNGINPLLTEAKGIILPDKIPHKNIYCRHEKPLFSFQETPDPEDENTMATLLFCGCLLLLLLIWVQLNKWFTHPLAPPAIAILFAVLRYCSLSFEWTKGFAASTLFDPSVLAMSEKTPNLGELLLSFIIFLFLINAVVRLLDRNRNKAPIRILALTGIALLLPLGLWMSHMGQLMVENSSIPLQLDQLFELDRYSMIVLFIIGIAGYSFILLSGKLIRTYLFANGSHRQLLLLVGAEVVLITGSTFFLPWLSLSVSLWIIAILGMQLLVMLRNGGKWNFTLILFALFVFSVSTSVNIRHYAGIKEMEERELYANQLADEKDINTELEYVTVKEKLLKDPYMQRFKSRSSRPEASELKEALERRVFNGYWERYDIDFFYFDDSSERFNGKQLNDLESLMKRHGEPAEIDTSLYFIKDYTSQYTYIFRLELQQDSSKTILFGTLKSKKIPEEIGFPRLLISDRAKVFESLGTYSIAKYYANKLVFKYGDYSYPVESGAFPEIQGKDKLFFDKDGFNHYFLRKTGRDYIILSRPNTGWLDGITTVAFLFVTYGALLALFLLFESRVSFTGFRELSLAVKIQVVLVGLVFASLLAFGIGSGTFVRSQYEEYTSDLIREKLHSIGAVSRIRLGELDSINDISESNIDLVYHLHNWSVIFVTDVNIYNLQGQLVGSSRPKIYNIGLLSEQMNPDARKAMVSDKKSEYIHQESIGSLKYLSAYTPFFNNEGKLIAYINLQHFDQQNEFESQIQHFLVAIINVFMLLLAFSVISAVFISSWLTSPLRLIRSSFSRMELGKNNQPIAYTSRDEIGDLVREYNQKLAELNLAAQNLAQSERESAWREMAKQVAHEIKNPLTPMKLSVQQLLRVYDPNNPDSKEKLERVAQSVIEQIDALTTIANAFSNFAKMPQPKTETINLQTLLENAVAVFSHEGSGEITLNISEPLIIQGDKEMLLRVMNNLITNSNQAIPSGRKGRILLEAIRSGNMAVITVSDNGSGIPEDKLQTIFEPYFTTKSTGTGLGLAMVRQIIEGHNGHIQVKSTSTEGTVMEVMLPLSD